MKREDIDLQANVGFALLAAANMLERALNERLQTQGITYRQSQVLGCLAYQSGLTQVDIAEMLQVEGPTIVRVLDRMERDCWIRRNPHPTDRRKNVIEPTAAARRIWRDILGTWEEVLASATSGMTKGQVQTVIEGVNQVRANLSSTPRKGQVA